MSSSTLFRSFQLTTRITIGKTTAAVTDANETYRVIPKTMIQTTAHITAAIGVNARSAPADVATPFPPLNFSHGGYKCPSTLDIAARIPNISGEFQSAGFPGAISIDIFTAPNPFKTSSANTG